MAANLAPESESPAQLSATEAARRIAKGEISSEELVAACLERIRALEPRVQAWTYLDEAHALAQAKASDELRRSGQPVGPLCGLPVGIKDIIDTADMPTENGCALHKGRAPRLDAAVVARLRAAGAVIMGKTVTTECAYFHPGKTRNPHNPEHTPGGSSSGSAAAVAASMVPLALGTQTNGSVIRPASFCGVYGYKPTHGLIPRTGVLLLSRTLDHVGVFGRTLEDAALVAEELVGWDEGDPDTRPRARPRLVASAAEEPPIPPVIGFLKTPQWERMDGDAKEGFAELCEALGDRVEEIDFLPSAEKAWDWQRTIMDAEMAHNFEREWNEGREQLSEPLRALLERGREIRAVDHQRAIAGIAPMSESFEELFTQRYDAILTPASLGAAPKGLGSTGNPAMNTLWTLSGLPSLTLPLLTAGNGLPIGVQLVGRKNYDARLFRTARWLVGKVSSV